MPFGILAPLGRVPFVCLSYESGHLRLATRQGPGFDERVDAGKWLIQSGNGGC